MSNFNLRQLQHRLAPQLWELLMSAATVATGQGWHLYLVGGAVRDLLLATPETNDLLIPDIDLAVDGLAQIVDAGAGVELATLLQQLYPSAQLNVHGTFQTAVLEWKNDPTFDSLSIDIATARTESYPYPAANPIVSASSIRQDLYRRDFTINAMALRLTADRSTSEHQPDILLDYFGGGEDLGAHQLRVLHPDSFIDDPTRIYRGVRFAVRLGFHFERQTEAYIRAAIASGIYDRTAREHPKTPALQTRLKTELKYLLQAQSWRSALELLGDLDALRCIHPSLKLDPELLTQLQLLDRCLRRFDRQQKLVHWQLKLEVIIAHLQPADRDRVAINLQLPADSISRLQDLDRSSSLAIELLPTYQRPSQIVELLQQYDLSMLILIALHCQNLQIVRRQIWKYLTIWINIKLILTGDDLRKLGYKPGPQYRQILDNLMKATLDGEITDRSTAEAFLSRF
jgi:tRNA nucleotidyltransferase (CCA-adding enzyme)